jgi:heat shock protein HslJ
MDDRLQGTWTITHLLPDGQRPLTAEITFEQGRLYFYAGCNRAVGSYTVDEGTLTAGPVALTMMYCPDMSTEQYLCRVLAEPLAIRVDDDTLHAAGSAGGFTARRA